MIRTISKLWNACRCAASEGGCARIKAATRLSMVALVLTSLVAASQAQLPDFVLDSEQSTGIAPHSITFGSGAWTSGTAAADKHGSYNTHDNGQHAANRWVQFTPSLPSAGWYRVYLWHVSSNSYATNVELEVNTADGLRTPDVDQKKNGGTWDLVGTFRFNAGSSGFVKVKTTRSDAVGVNGYVAADAVRFAKVEPEVIVDSHDATGVSFTGIWTAVTDTPTWTTARPAVNSNYYHDSNTGQNGVDGRSIEFKPSIPVSGKYQVYVTWVGDPTNSRNAHIDVYHAGAQQPDRSSVDQRSAGYEWVYIGDYEFKQGANENGRVVISNRFDAANGETGGRVVVDAVRFVRIPLWEQVIDDVDTGVPAGTPPYATAEGTGTWIQDTVNSLKNPSRLGRSHERDGNPATKGNHNYLFKPSFPTAGNYSVYAWWPSNGATSTATPFEIISGGAVVNPAPPLQNQSINGGRWNFLGKWSFSSGNTNGVRLKNVGANGSVYADGIAFVLDEDGDEDGMLDSWEVAHGLDWTRDDTGDDLDGDGYTNLQESQMHTDPEDFYNGVAPVLTYISGTNQFSDPNTFVLEPLVVEVRTPPILGSQLLSNAPVSFTVQSGGGLLALNTSGTRVAALTVRTDSSGQAQVYFKQPNTNGTDSSVLAVAGTSVSTSNTIPFALHSNLLVGYWKFDESSGSFASDSSPSAPPNNGTVAVGATFEQSFDYVAPTTDNALRFNGTTGYVSVPNSTSLVFTGAPFSVSAWIKLNAGISLAANTDIYPIASAWSGTTGTGGFEFSIIGGTAKGLSLRTYSSGVVTQEIVPTADQRALLSNGLPHLVTYTRDSSYVGRLYIDGVEVGSASAMTASLNSGAGVTIGRGTTAGTRRYFAGVIDDLRLLKTTLRPQEIASAYSSDGDALPDWWEKKYFGDLSKTDAADDDSDLLSNLQEYLRGTNPTDSDTNDDGFLDGEELVGFWKFDETSGSQVSDSSPAVPKNHGTLSTSGWTREQSFDFFSPGPDNAIRFDGAAGFVTVNNSATLAFSGSSFSASAWIKLNSNVSLALDTEAYPVVSKWNGTGGGFELVVKGGSGGKGLSFRSYSNGLVAQEIIPASDCRAKLTDGYPHLVVYTRDANNVGRLYLDGAEVGVGTPMQASFGSSAPLLIGANSSRYFPGLIDDVKLYLRTLASREIANTFDLDKDTLPDWWEKRHFGDLAKLATGDDDTGGTDGLTNLQEYQLGTSPALRDTEGDGMPDGWEVLNGLNPLIDDSTADKDGDRLSNLAEYQRGTGVSNPDTDGDTMSDGWEEAFGLNPTVWNDPNIDPDGDGMTNGEESRYWRNPNSAGVSETSTLNLRVFTPFE